MLGVPTSKTFPFRTKAGATMSPSACARSLFAWRISMCHEGSACRTSRTNVATDWAEMQSPWTKISKRAMGPLYRKVSRSSVNWLTQSLLAQGGPAGL